jgi:hypothetical protein
MYGSGGTRYHVTIVVILFYFGNSHFQLAEFRYLASKVTTMKKAIGLFFLLQCLAAARAQQINEALPPDSSTSDRTFERVEIEAEFPGGNAGWIAFLQKNLKADVPVNNGAPIGKYTVMVQFIVNKDGAVSNIKPLTSIGYGMEEEVVRILRKSGNWTPAVQNGRPVKAYRKQPITFVVEDEDVVITSSTPFVLFVRKNNEISVTVRKVKPEDIALTTPGGTVVPMGDGKFNVKVSKTGRVELTITNSKKNKRIGVASFEVRE